MISLTVASPLPPVERPAAPVFGVTSPEARLLDLPAHELPSLDTAECPPVDGGVLAATDTVLASDTQSANEAVYQRYLGQVEWQRDMGRDIDYGDAQTAAEAEIRNDTASKLGLTIFRPDVEDLKTDAYGLNQGKQNPGEIPVQEYIDRTAQFLRQYGIELQIAAPTEKYVSSGLVGPQKEDLESIYTKRTLLNLMSFMAKQPKEMIELIGWKYVRLLATDPNRAPKQEVAAAAALTAQARRTMLLNITGELPESAVAHEAGHFMDAAFCGWKGAAFDSELQTLNGSYGYSIEDRDPFVTDPLADVALSKLYMEAGFAFEQHDEAHFQTVGKRVLRLLGQITFISAAKSIPEDKADINGELIGKKRFERILNDEKVPLEAKFIYQCARLAQHDPRLAVWYATTASHAGHIARQNPLIQALQDAA